MDQAAGGRELPRWFSEGFAQYAEYRLTGFTLPLTDGLTPPLSADTDWAASRPGCAGVFSLSGLDPLFQREDTQLWAYYLSFQAFEKLLQETNWQTIASILSEVRNGTLFADAFSSVTGWDFEIWAGKILFLFCGISRRIDRETEETILGVLQSNERQLGKLPLYKRKYYQYYD